MLRLFSVAFLLVGTADFPADCPAWQGVVEIAAGRCEKGPWRQNDSRYDYVDDGTVAFAPDGRVLLAWADQATRDAWLRTRRARCPGPRQAARPIRAEHFGSGATTVILRISKPSTIANNHAACVAAIRAPIASARRSGMSPCVVVVAGRKTADPHVVKQHAGGL
jgi:hypothetical protein